MSADAGNATGEQPPARRATLLQTARIVACGLFMVGRNRDYGPEAPSIDPLRLVALAFAGMALVIAALVLLALSIAH